MLFNTSVFLIFLLIVLCVHFILPHRARVFWLIAASAFFYAYAYPKYLLILLLVIAVDYTSALGIVAWPKYRKLLLVASICSNIGILFFFKYFNFAIENVNALTGSKFDTLDIILPIGLSFHTFQSLSYVVEVYKGRFTAEKSLPHFSLYVLYFPQLVAGPIERPQNVLPQLHKHQILSWQNILDGARLTLFGLFKKVVIADRLAIYVDAFYDDPASYAGVRTITAMLFFSIQIYCDFSGYSDMAIGISKMFGIDLMVNFNRPYFSTNIQSFWTRWHISLSTWFKDYVYIPLGGSRQGRMRGIFALCVVFILSGLWHGASWHFVIWGALHALFVLLFVNICQPILRTIKMPKVLSVLLTFIIVSFLWIWFRAENAEQAWLVTQNVFKINFANAAQEILSMPALNMSGISMSLALASLVLMLVIESYTDARLQILNQYVWLDVSLSLLLIVLVWFFGIFTEQSFIYFQF